MSALFCALAPCKAASAAAARSLAARISARASTKGSRTDSERSAYAGLSYAVCHPYCVYKDCAELLTPNSAANANAARCRSNVAAITSPLARSASISSLSASWRARSPALARRAAVLAICAVPFAICSTNVTRSCAADKSKNALEAASNCCIWVSSTSAIAALALRCAASVRNSRLLPRSQVQSMPMPLSMRRSPSTLP